MQNLETQIEEAEERLTKTELALADPELYLDPKKAQALNQKYTALKEEIERLYQEWDEAT